MGKVKRRRQQENDRRSGRAWAANAANRPAAVGPPPAEAYTVLAAHLDRVRTALAGDRFTHRPRYDVQHDQADLERSLSDAVARAFAAAANGSAVPDGVTSWAGEGLARSHERELLLLATHHEATYARPMDLPFPYVMS
jgi:hypothetical protein